MPLVTVTCTEKYYVPDEETERPKHTPEQASTLRLMQALPSLMVNNAKLLRLDATTPVKAVQVEPRKFHIHTVNPVDLWVKVELTEKQPFKWRRNRVRRNFLKMLQLQLASRYPDAMPTVALDIFYGPGAGGFIEDGQVAMTW